MDEKQTVTQESPTTADATASAGETDYTFEGDGTEADSSSESDGGLDSSTTVEGQTTSEQVAFASTGKTDTVTNPDGSKIVDTYVGGLLMGEQDLSAAGSITNSIGYGYNALRQINSETTLTNGVSETTNFTLRPDGSVASETLPDGETETVTAFNPITGNPTATTDPDGKTVSEAWNSLGELTSQSGDGNLAASFGYNTTTGNQTSLTTYLSGIVNGSGAETTQFGYDHSTGAMTSQTFADGTQDTWHDNAAGQLDSATMPGVNESLGYDPSGNLNTETYAGTDGSPSVSDTVVSRDLAERPLVTTETENGVTTTTTDAYNGQDQLASDRSGPTGATVQYAYYPAGDTAAGAAAGAVQSVKIVLAGVTIGETDYAYNATSGQVASITVVGENGAASQTFNYTYTPDTGLIASASGGGSSTSYQYNPQTDELSSLGTVSAAGATIFGGAYAYNSNFQQSGATITQTDANGSNSSYSNGYGYDSQNELNSVTKDPEKGSKGI